METLPQGSSVCHPKAEVQSHLDPRDASQRVSWKHGSMPAAHTKKKKLFTLLQKHHFVTQSPERFPSGECMEMSQVFWTAAREKCSFKAFSE